MDVGGLVTGQEHHRGGNFLGVLIRRDGMRASTPDTWSAASSTRSVAIGPGATAFTRTPCGPYSTAHDLVSECTAAFVDEYSAARRPR